MTYFFELAEASKESVRAAGGSPVMMYMDFVGMKFYNAKHGFSKGDMLLQSFARILASLRGDQRTEGGWFLCHPPFHQPLAIRL